jgi:hypothetical protein
VLLNGAEKRTHSLRFEDELLLPFAFDVDFVGGISVSAGDTVEIRKAGTTVFKGIVETKKRAIDVLGIAVTGIDAGSKKLSRFLTGEISFDDVEPSQLVRFLNIPCQELGAGIIRQGFGSDYDWAMGTYCYVWEQHASEWKIKGSKQTVPADFLRAYLVRTPAADSQTNYHMVVRLRIDSCAIENDTSDTDLCAGLIARFTDANNFYAAYLGEDTVNNRLVLKIDKVVAGTRTNVAQSADPVGWSFGSWVTLHFIVSSTSLIVYVDELDARLTATDSSLASGKFGLLSGNAQTRFKDLIVQKIGAASASSSVTGSSPGAAFDGDPVSFWRADTRTQQWWLKYDLGEIKSNICAVLVKMSLEPYLSTNTGVPEDFPGIIIEYNTTDSEPYTQISSDQYVRCGDHLKVFTPVSMRYLRIKSIATSYPMRPKIFIISIYQATEGGRLLTEGDIHDFEDGISFEVQNEPRGDAIRRIAEQIGWNAWCSADERLHFVVEKGTVRRQRRFVASEDTFADNTSDYPHGTDNYVEVLWDDPWVQRAYLKYDLSGIASSAVVKAAALHWYRRPVTVAFGAPFDIQVRRPDSSWYESTLKWTNQPTSTLVKIVTFNGEFPSRWEVELKDLVASWIAGTIANNGICLRCDSESGSDKRILAASKDGDLPEEYTRSRMAELFVDYFTSDKSSIIKFEHGTTFHLLEKTEEAMALVWKAKVLGWGEGVYQLSGEYSDSSIKTSYPTLAKEYLATEKDITDPYLLAVLAKKIVQKHSTSVTRIRATVRDTYTVGSWQAGDLVTLISSDLSLSGAWRILSISRGYGGDAETVEIEVCSQDQAVLLSGRESIEDLLVDLRERMKRTEKIDQNE